MLHKDISTGHIHIPYQWVYADATARQNATGFVSSDIGKLSRQLDNNSLWMLTAITPSVTWVQIGGGGGGGGITFTQPPGSPITMNQNEEVTVTHPAVTNEKVMFNVFEEVAAQTGLTNIETDFDLADESKYIQEDAVNGTDFVDGVVKLHGSIGSVDSYTKLLLHCDGPNGSTTFTDSSPSPKTVTAYGNAQISTAQSKFGGASAYFDGSGDYLSVPDSEDWNFGTGDFTIDTWVRLSVLGINDIIAGKGSTYWLAYNFTAINGTANKFVFSAYNGSIWTAVNSITSPTTDEIQ